MSFILYEAKNLVNGHRYVGITGRGLPTRKSQHYWNAKNGSRTRIASAIRKYGQAAIEFSILQTLATREEAIQAEIEFIKTHRPEYNVTKGGDGAVGVIVGPETRKKLSLAIKARLERDGNWWKGRKHSPETAELMRARRLGSVGHWRGKKRPPETVEKFRAAKRKNPVRYWLGKKRSPETVQKIIATKASRPKPPLTEKQLISRRLNFQKCQASKLRKVRCLDDGIEYCSLTEAGLAYGIGKEGIWRSCSGKTKAVHGRRFEYV